MNGVRSLYESDDEAIEAWESDDESVMREGEFLGALLPALGSLLPSVVQGIGGLLGGGGGPQRPPLPQVQLPSPGSGVQSAQLSTPAGQAMLRLPAEVPTKDDLRQIRDSMQAALATETTRINTLQRDLQSLTQRVAVVVSDTARDVSRVRGDLARTRREQATAVRRLRSDMNQNQMMSMMFPLLFQRQLQDALDNHTHTIGHQHSLPNTTDKTGDPAPTATAAPTAQTGSSSNSSLLFMLPFLMGQGQGQDSQSSDQSTNMGMMMAMMFALAPPSR